MVLPHCLDAVATLVFARWSWELLLWTIAAGAVAWEVGAVARMAWLGATRTVHAVVLTVSALAAGPAVALGAIVYGGMVSEPGQAFKGKSVIAVSLRGSLAACLVALLAFDSSASNRWPAPALVVIAVCAGLWTLRSYRRTTSPISKPTRRRFLALRIAVIALLACWTAGPAREYYDTQMIRGAVLIGVDSSASMAVRDMPADPSSRLATAERETISRAAAVKAALLAQRKVLEALATETDVHIFEFASVAAATRAFDPADDADAADRALQFAHPVRHQTAIGDSASGASDAFIRSHVPLAAIMLITDGCNNTSKTISPDKLAAVMGSRGVPIFTVGAGSDKATLSTRTLNIRDLTCADEVDAFNRLPIQATLEAIGMEGSKLKVTCRFGEKKIASSIVNVNKPNFRMPLKYEHLPLDNGFRRVIVSVERLGSSRRPLAGQHTASRLVHVVDRELRVLYVEGKFRYEKKFITTAISAGRRFRVIPVGPKGLGQMGDELKDWLGFHAIIFGDIAASNFSPQQLETVKQLVSQYGKGFCMIGGADSFARGGWGKTPIADILGVDMAASVGHIADDITVQPTPEGLQAEMMWISPDSTPVATAAAWRELPSMPGANVLAGLKPLATALGVSQNGSPLIVAQSYGNGRSLAIAFDMTWRWVLTPKDTAEMQKRFWRQVALYLAAPKGNVWIATDKARYSHTSITADAQLIRVTAGVENAQGRPLLSTRAKVTLTSPSSVTTDVLLRADKTTRIGHLTGLSDPGEYALKISTEVDGKPMSAEHRFEVIKRDLESLDVLADFDLLKRMAAASDGQFHPLSKLGALLADMKISAKPKLRVVAQRDNLANILRWPLLIAIIAMLCTEWSLRKRRGLI